MTLLETLIEGRRRIAEVGWTQGAFARDMDGHDVSVRSRNATAFCAGGACGKSRRAQWALVKIIDQGLASWNDEPGRTSEEVIALFDKAIADVRGRAS